MAIRFGLFNVFSGARSTFSVVDIAINRTGRARCVTPMVNAYQTLQAENDCVTASEAVAVLDVAYAWPDRCSIPEGAGGNAFFFCWSGRFRADVRAVSPFRAGNACAPVRRFP